HKAVEAGLASDDCRKTASTTCSLTGSLATLANDDLNSTGCNANGVCGYQSYRLWTRHRVRPQHARDLVAQLAAALPKVVYVNGSIDTTQPNWPGAMRLVGVNDKIVDGASIGATAGAKW